MRNGFILHSKCSGMPCWGKVRDLNRWEMVLSFTANVLKKG